MNQSTSVMWKFADEFDVIPAPPNKIVARSLAKWWERPRQFGCVTAKSSPWFVVAPDFRVWCANCAPRRLEAETRCVYCHRPVDHALDRNYIFEMRGITVLAKAHVECEMKAEEK